MNQINSTYSPLELKWIEEGLVYISDLDLIIDLKYSRYENVFKTKLYTNFEKPFAHPFLYEKLKQAVVLLSQFNPNYKFIVWDVLRPHNIQKIMWDNFEHTEKSNFIAHPSKKSIHNFGLAIDLSIYDISLDSELNMGTIFDDFTEKSHFNSSQILNDEKTNRILLRSIMTSAGFIPYDNEWWHFEALDKTIVKNNFKLY